MKNVNNEAEKKEIYKYIYMYRKWESVGARPCCFSPKRTLKVFQVFASCLIMSRARSGLIVVEKRWGCENILLFARTVSPLYSSHFKCRPTAYRAGFFLKRRRPTKSPRRGLIHTHVLYKGLIRQVFPRRAPLTDWRTGSRRKHIIFRSRVSAAPHGLQSSGFAWLIAPG